MNHKHHSEEKAESSEGVGRISNNDVSKGADSERSGEASDISHIDQQEGNMNNGNVGGNFTDKDTQEKGN
jgi:hypothetical protein